MAAMQDSQALKEQFSVQFLTYIERFQSSVSTTSGEWVIKGFIDIARNIYTISTDTKVVSKVIELLLFPQICQFAQEHGYRMVLCKEQNFYPDISFLDRENNKFAVDVKSTYRRNDKETNGMTLGAFTGYFRDRESTKNTTFPYGSYTGHFVLGVIYSRKNQSADERKVYRLDDLQSIASVIRDFTFFFQEKYRISIDRPGSGNTKNIGSVTRIDKLIQGNGPFAELGETIFDDYWMYYLTKDMARAVEMKSAPYRNLSEYLTYRGFKK